MEKNLLINLVPLNALTPYNLGILAEQTEIETLPKGTQIFAQGDDDDFSIYLLSGEIVLSTDPPSRERNIVGGTQLSRYALAQLKPRQFTGLAKTPVTILRFESKLLDNLLSWDQTASYEVTEFDAGEDFKCIIRLMQSKIFLRLPSPNIDALLRRFQTISVKAGQIIIRQGEPGDYYYLIRNGKADVLRKLEKQHKVSLVDHLEEGEGFGESALLSNSPRNATVVMATDGVLLRLGKKDFDELLREPIVDWLGLEEARSLVKAGASLLDVRLEDEFVHGTILGSANLPLHLLRKRVDELDPNRHYIVFCQNGNRSCAAVFLLTQLGITASALQGGLDGLRKNSSPQ
ncbi:MAG: cyclic nucleotide-binding protein [Candidatus Methylumidiphilus alinenensis]|uniref:Cyclic nucleotide-binding protein n=1 Tax=Candidatus Methylumidiphilus alinenensis TaxID=2202197 RepID=A0A2W4RVB8_9GAMM|nr:MAG: cyclic nucleotide-binding protein [Candidatus Methylumidiphilus alinenensis]